MWIKCLEKSVVSPEDPVMIKHGQLFYDTTID